MTASPDLPNEEKELPPYDAVMKALDAFFNVSLEAQQKQSAAFYLARAHGILSQIRVILPAIQQHMVWLDGEVKRIIEEEESATNAFISLTNWLRRREFRYITFQGDQLALVELLQGDQPLPAFDVFDYGESLVALGLAAEEDLCTVDLGHVQYACREEGQWYNKLTGEQLDGTTPDGLSLIKALNLVREAQTHE